MVMSDEKWCPVVGWEEAYEISDQGRLRSLTRKVATKGGKFRTVKSQLIRPRINRGGYEQVTLSFRRKPCTVLIHRLVCEAFHGPAPEGKPLVLHWDGDRLNNRVGNLRWGDNADNMADLKRHGGYVSFYSLKTHCPRGHEYTDSNTYIIPTTGSRSCRTCKKVQNRESWRRRHGKSFEGN